jgi:hypothetical protein
MSIPNVCLSVEIVRYLRELYSGPYLVCTMHYALRTISSDTGITDTTMNA